jgi:hypothetical protein
MGDDERVEALVTKFVDASRPTAVGVRVNVTVMRLGGTGRISTTSSGPITPSTFTGRGTPTTAGTVRSIVVLSGLRKMVCTW